MLFRSKRAEPVPIGVGIGIAGEGGGVARAGCSADCGAGPPVEGVGVIGICLGSDEDEAGALAVRTGRPGEAVAVSESPDQVSIGGEEDEFLASIVELVSFSHAVRAVDQGRRSEEHTSELQSRTNLVCRLLLEKKK